MAEFPAMPMWTDAYLADTGHLTTIEHGAFLLLLMTSWRSGCRLPNDDKRLARYARLTAGQWARIKPTILSFFTVEGEWLMQGRLTDTLMAVRQRSKVASDNARAKYRKNKEPVLAAAAPEAGEKPPTKTKTKTTRVLATQEAREVNEAACRIEFAMTFWPAYPHKTGRAKAIPAFLVQRRHADLEAIMAGLERYKATKPTERQWLNPTTFLNQERYRDEPADPPAERPAKVTPHATLFESLARTAEKFGGLDGGQADPDAGVHPDRGRSPAPLLLEARPIGVAGGR